VKVSGLRTNSASFANVGRDATRNSSGRTERLSRGPWLVAILLISTAPLFAQAQQPDMAKLKDDAQKVVSIISGDKAKTQTFCQMVIVGNAINEAIQEQDNKKAAELAQKLTDLEKNLDPEYVALVDALRDIDLNSKEAQEIVSTFDTLDASCPH
jgi:hypothetical protein